MNKVTKILDPNFRSGEKNGKPWVLCKLEVDDKIEATGFAPIAEGDEVELQYNDKYKNYSATKVTAKSREQNELKELILEANRKLDKLLAEIEKEADRLGAKPLESGEELPF